MKDLSAFKTQQLIDLQSAVEGRAKMSEESKALVLGCKQLAYETDNKIKAVLMKELQTRFKTQPQRKKLYEITEKELQDMIRVYENEIDLNAFSDWKKSIVSENHVTLSKGQNTYQIYLKEGKIHIAYPNKQYEFCASLFAYLIKIDFI